MTQSPDVPRFAIHQDESGRLVLNRADAVWTFDCVAPSVMRVTIRSPGGAAPRGSPAMLPSTFVSRPKLEARGTRTRADWNDLTVFIERAPFRVRICDGDERELFESVGVGSLPTISLGRSVFARLGPDERVQGLGEKVGPTERRGRAFVFWNTDAFGYEANRDPLYKAIPFLLRISDGSVSGILLDHPGRTTIDVGARDPNILEWTAPEDGVRLFVVAGPSVRDVLDRYTALTGRPAQPPRWALGYQQCRYSYHPDSRVRAVANGFRQSRIPCDVLYLDIHYMDRFRSFTWDRTRFPDLPGLLDELHRDGFRAVAIIDPGLVPDPSYGPFVTGRAIDAFLADTAGEPHLGRVWPGDCVFPDFLRADVRHWFGGLYEPLVAAGLDGFWNDMNEPAILEAPSKTVPLDLVHEPDGMAPVAHEFVHNIYGALMAEATFDGLERLRPGVRPFVLTRAAHAGSQRVAAGWSGDNRSTWEDLRQSLPMGLGMGLSGFPFYGPDLGGFIGHPEPELVIRWLQLGAFFGLMRMHSFLEAPDKEPWSFGEPCTTIVRQAIERRYRMLPTLEAYAYEAATTGCPLLRPVWFDAPGEDALFDRDDQFLFGDALLVTPVVERGALERSVRLPPGPHWDLDRDLVLDGSRAVAVPTPLDRVPMFLRPGGILLRQAVVQHTGEDPGPVLEVDVMMGRDGAIVAREGDRGDRAASADRLTRFAWCEARREFVIESLADRIPGGFREYVVRVHGPDSATETFIVTRDRLPYRWRAPIAKRHHDSSEVRVPATPSEARWMLKSATDALTVPGWVPRPTEVTLRWSVLRTGLHLIVEAPLPVGHEAPVHDVDDGLFLALCIDSNGSRTARVTLRPLDDAAAVAGIEARVDWQPERLLIAVKLTAPFLPIGCERVAFGCELRVALRDGTRLRIGRGITDPHRALTLQWIGLRDRDRSLE